MPEELDEELPKKETNPMKTLTTLAMEGGEQAIKAITEFKNSIPEEAWETEEGESGLAYLQFLLELAAAEDKNAFFQNADPEMSAIVQTLLGEKTDPLELLTLNAYEGSEGTKERIQEIINAFPEEARETEEGKLIFAYLQFLLELATAENRQEFLKKADPDMVKIMLQYMSEPTEEPAET
ncbi:MAG: hypothetical protein GY754_03165 [bacterium]|nr:hypothetical protein [bacterium]